MIFPYLKGQGKTFHFVSVCVSVYTSACMSVCVSVCLSVPVWVCVCMYTCMSMYMCVCVYLCVCVSLCMCVSYESVCLHVSTCLCVCVYRCVCMSLCVCMYLCVCVHLHVLCLRTQTHSTQSWPCPSTDTGNLSLESSPGRASALAFSSLLVLPRSPALEQQSSGTLCSSCPHMLQPTTLPSCVWARSWNLAWLQHWPCQLCADKLPGDAPGFHNQPCVPSPPLPRSCCPLLLPLVSRPHEDTG